ncbi:DUF86 domain-containing protein [Bacteroidia bacterium]|nr:DUF86 domain-containing protein [Bacteroidia bacterium]
MPKSPVEYLRHIADECQFILSIAPAIAQENLLADETKKRALVRSLEIIGEASKQIPADFKQEWPMVNWKNMAGMRDKLIHDYMGVNYNIVWDVVFNKIPELAVQIAAIISQESPDGLNVP